MVIFSSLLLQAMELHLFHLMELELKAMVRPFPHICVKVKTIIALHLWCKLKM